MEILIANTKGGVGKTTLTLAFADILNAQIVEWDLQKTIANCAQITGRHTPVGLEEINAHYVIHDTPPYNSDCLKSLIKRVDYILIPSRLSSADLVATKTIIDIIRALGATAKATIVFNAVRKPYNSAYHAAKKYFASSFKDIKKATTELPQLISLQTVIEKPVQGQAKEACIALLKELNIH